MAEQGLPYRSGTRVRVRFRGRMVRGRISSIHRIRGGIEYVACTEPTADHDIGHVVNLWAEDGRPTGLELDNEGER